MLNISFQLIQSNIQVVHSKQKNIHITIDENKILADELQGSLNSNIINLNGNIILDSKPYLLYADTLLYDHFVKTGIFENVSLKVKSTIY